MSIYLPDAVRKGLEEARKAMQRRSNRLCVHDGDDVHRVLRLWDSGFALDAKDAPQLRGFVDIYDGSRHLYQCLIVASYDQDSEKVYDFKWSTAVAQGPALDFVRADDAPVALIPRLL